ncbi:hypothetical protein [Sphingobium sp.]|uniref:hypothetical protein n=1 Tax=Sphingobium sp. TaxID=1912891 RepID=UPI003BB5AFC9
MTRSASLTPDQQSGKAAFKALAKAYGGQQAVEAETGIRQQEISDCGLPNVARFASIDLVDTLEDRTHGTAGWPHVTSWLCRRRGGVFVPLPQGEDTPDGMMLTVAELAAELGDVSRAVSEGVCASGDGGQILTDRERDHVLTELDGLDRASARLRLKLNKMTGDAV